MKPTLLTACTAFRLSGNAAPVAATFPRDSHVAGNVRFHPPAVAEFANIVDSQNVTQHMKVSDCIIWVTYTHGQAASNLHCILYNLTNR